MKKEIRIYVFNAGAEVDTDSTNEEIIAHCEKTGEIYSLQGFENSCNNEDLYLTESFIRFIEIDTDEPDKEIKISEEAHLQLIESVNSAEGRITNGAEIEEGFNWLREELEQIKNGIAVNDTSLTK